MASRRTISLLGHVRFVAKYRLLRRAGSTLRGDTGAFLRYLVLDNELHTFSYPIRNEPVLAERLAGPLNVDAPDVVELFDEGRRVLGEKRRKPFRRVREPSGQRLAWYAITRVRKPAVVIESGVERGLGSLVVLSALEANRREGFEGELYSIDPAAGAGFVVPRGLREYWTLVKSPSSDALPAVLADRRVDLYLHDSLSFLGPDELRLAVTRATPHFVFTTWDTPAMREELSALGAMRVSFVDDAIHPVFKGRRLLIGFFDGTLEPRIPAV